MRGKLNMAKKKALYKKQLYVILGENAKFPVVRENGKYWYTATSQFRKGAFTVVEREIPGKAATEAEAEEKEGE